MHAPHRNCTGLQISLDLGMPGFIHLDFHWTPELLIWHSTGLRNSTGGTGTLDLALQWISKFRVPPPGIPQDSGTPDLALHHLEFHRLRNSWNSSGIPCTFFTWGDIHLLTVHNVTNIGNNC